MNAPDKPAKFKPIARGPQRGAPPSLEFIALDRLSVDPAYQRATDTPGSRRILVGMVRQWDWALCQPLVVSRRADGTLWIIDGQHRHCGALERGDIAHLPCVVLSGIAESGEASAFVKLNTERQSLSQIAVFRGMVTAGDPDAVQVAALLAETGWRLTASKNAKRWQPGDMISAPKLVNSLRGHGADAVRAALTTLRSAYPDQAVPCTASLLQSLVEIYRPGGKLAPSRHPELASAMARVDAATWLDLGRAFVRSTGCSDMIGRARAILECLNSPSAEPGRVAPAGPQIQSARGGQGATAERPSAAAAPAVSVQTRAARAFTHTGTNSGKGWCDQCDAMVDPPTARACKSSFCKMRAAA